MPLTAPPSPRPTAFLLHALGGSARAFDAVAKGLGDTFDVVALDLPGFGGAPTASGVTVEAMATGVIHAIRRSGASRWILVGHSMGGKIATVVAARTLSGEAPLFGLAGVVLLAGSPPSPEPISEERRADMLGWAADGPLDTSAARTFVDANVGSPLDADADALAVTDLLRTDREAWLAWLERGSREDWSAEVGVLDLPALLLAGGDDSDLGEDAQRRLNGRVYPRASVAALAGAGHLLPLERPAEVVLAVRMFWQTEAGRGPVPPADVARTIASDRTSARTRRVLARRALADSPAYTPRVLGAAQLATLRAVADRVVPQDGHPVDLAARVDTQLAAGDGDGWRNAELPTDAEAYRAGLDALVGFAEMPPEEQNARLTAIAAGDSGHVGALTAEQAAAWFEDVRVDLVRQWLAHPATMARIGFDGFANGGDGVRLQGFDRLGAGEREGWEPLMVHVR